MVKLVIPSPPVHKGGMGLTCNLDAKGKALRLVSGIIASLIGIGMIVFWARGSGETMRWVWSLVVVGFGAFQIFEGWAGWCGVRAMGIKTRI